MSFFDDRFRDAWVVRAFLARFLPPPPELPSTIVVSTFCLRLLFLHFFYDPHFRLVHFASHPTNCAKSRASFFPLYPPFLRSAPYPPIPYLSGHAFWLFYDPSDCLQSFSPRSPECSTIQPSCPCSLSPLTRFSIVVIIFLPTLFKLPSIPFPV